MPSTVGTLPRSPKEVIDSVYLLIAGLDNSQFQTFYGPNAARRGGAD